MSATLKPFDFFNERAPERRPPLAIPLLDFLLVVALLAFGYPRLTFSQGIPIELPGGVPEVTDGVSCLSVLTLVNKDLMFLEGERLSLVALPGALAALERSDDTPAALFLKADRRASMETFSRICAIARSQGFQVVQMATIEPEAKTGSR